MADPNTVPATAPTGEEFDIPVESIPYYKSKNWDVQDPHETLGQEAATLGEGTLKGLIPGAPAAEAGISKALGSTAGSIEEQKARGEVNPILHGVGEYGIGMPLQMAGVAAATGGLGLGAEAVGEGAELLSPAVEAGTAVMKGADAAAAVKAAGTSEGAISAAADAMAARAPASAAEAAARSTAAGYAAQGAAGAVQGGSNYINEAELGDHDFNGEALAMNIGLGGLFGVAGEGAANVLGKTVVPAVISKAEGAADALKERLGSMATKVAETIYPEARGKFGPAMRGMLEGAENMTDAEAEAFANETQKLGEGLKQAGIAHETADRGEEAGKLLQDVAAAPVKQALSQFKDSINEKMGDIQNKIDGGIYKNVGPFKQIKQDLTHFEAALENPEATSAELHDAALEFKQAVGKSGIHNPSWSAPGVNPDAKAAIDDLVHNVWGASQDVMRAPEIWEQQAGRNAALDSAKTLKINAAKQVAKDFGSTEIDLENGKNELYIKPSKVRSGFAGDPLANQEKLEHLGNYIDASKKYIDELKTSAGNAGSIVPGGDDLTALLEHLTAGREAAMRSGAVTQLERSLSRTVGRGPLEASLVPGLVAHAAGLGMPGVGLVAAAAGLAHNPLRAMQMFAKIAKASSTAKDLIGSGVRKLMATPSAKTALTGEVSSALRSRTIQSIGGMAAGSDFDRQSKHITELASDQQRQMNALGQNTARLNEVAPQTTVATHRVASTALNILAQSIPKNPAPSALASENKGWQPDPGQKAAWDDLHAAILHPPRILSQLADGTASPETWSALQQAYPKWTGELQQQMTDHITQHPKLELGQQQKFAISMVLGTPISPTVAPENIAASQAMYQQQAPPMMPPMKQHRPSQHGMDKIDLGTRSALGPESRRRG